MVMSVDPGLRSGLRPSQFSALFSSMLWHMELKFYDWLNFNARKIKFECYQYAVFRTFLQYASTYWVEILYTTFFLWTLDQVRVLLICVNFGRSYAPFGTYNTGNEQFSALSFYMVWHIELEFCIRLLFYDSRESSIGEWKCNKNKHSFCKFSATRPLSSKKFDDTVKFTWSLCKSKMDIM